MCRGIEDYLPAAKCWVHPGTTLERSTKQHMYHFETIRSDALVLLHIGTNDIASGAPPSLIIQRMKTLIISISQASPHILYFAISAVLPWLTDDSTKKKNSETIQHHATSLDYSLRQHYLSKDIKTFPQTWKNSPPPIQTRWTPPESTRKTQTFYVLSAIPVAFLPLSSTNKTSLVTHYIFLSHTCSH